MIERKMEMKLVEVENVLDEKEKSIGKVMTGDFSDIMNIQLKAGEVIPEHNAPFEVIVICRSGEVKFPVEGQEFVLNEKSVLLLAPNENHSLEAKTDCDLIVIKIKK